MTQSERDAVIEECARVCDELERTGYVYETHDEFDEILAEACHCADVLRALKSQPAAPDPRDEVIRLARVAIDAHLNPCGCFNGCEFCNGKATLSEALAAIDALPKKGK